MDKISCGVLGATGLVGQTLISLLEDHPWLNLTAVAASPASEGSCYQKCVKWQLKTDIPPIIANKKLHRSTPPLPCHLLFSALKAEVAGEIESRFVEAGYWVISNTHSHRQTETVPLLIPEVNGAHSALLAAQKSSGALLTNPNCSTTGLALALKPLEEAFGVDEVHVVTLQALSGAGISAKTVTDNVVPYIQGEEEKIETEPLKIFGTLLDGKIQPHRMKISARCHRVPVSDGHLMAVSVKLKTKAVASDLYAAWDRFNQNNLQLPSSPDQLIYCFKEAGYPQPLLHNNLGKGMAISIGQLKPCSLFDFKFSLLVNNMIRGGAGGALLNAEFFLKQFINSR